MQQTTALGYFAVDASLLRLRRWFRASGGRNALQLPAAYLSYIAVSALDGFCTGMILLLGGAEANPIAAAVLMNHGFTGMLLFKFTIVSLVIVICEQIMRHRPKAAKRVMRLAVAATSVPVVIAVVEFYFHASA